MKLNILLPALLSACLFSLSASEEPPEKTKRVYLMGSSLTDQVKYHGLQQLAESRGYRHIWGNHGIPGAPIRIIWGARNSKRGRAPFYASGKALGEFQWDAVTIEPRAEYSKDFDAACKFIDYTLNKSPEVQFYVFAQWPRIRRGGFDRQWLENSKDIQNNIRLGFEEFLKDLRKKYADIPNPPLMIPVGHAMHLLELKIQAGLVPVMKSIYDGYSDGSHQNNLGEYIVGCTFFSTIYKESPVGLPSEPYGDIPSDLAAVIQETVWEAVNAHPLSGVKAEGEFRIITPWFPPAVEGELFSRELHSAFGKGEVIWSLADGELPSGISVDPKGLLTGASNTTGDFTFTLKAIDERGTAALRKLKLICEPESKPEIPEQIIPQLRVGEYLYYPIKINGGNGDITWHPGGMWVKEGEVESAEWKKVSHGNKHSIPPGLDLSHNGVLSGGAAKQGIYKVRFIAADSDPNAPDIAERELIINVGLPGPGACLAVPVEDRPEIDGIPDKAFGTLDCAVTKTVKGNPSCSANFAAVYYKGGVYIAVEVKDEKIVTGSDNPWEDDSIEIYVDKNNNHEKEYNSDDCRIVCSVSGKIYTYNLEERRVKGVFRKTESGYTAEIVIGLNGIRKPNRVWGFDLGVNDNDGAGTTGRIMWKGTAENETDTSGFGALVFSEGRSQKTANRR